MSLGCYTVAWGVACRLWMAGAGFAQGSERNVCLGRRSPRFLSFGLIAQSGLIEASHTFLLGIPNDGFYSLIGIMMRTLAWCFI